MMKKGTLPALLNSLCLLGLMTTIFPGCANADKVPIEGRIHMHRPAEYFPGHVTPCEDAALEKWIYRLSKSGGIETRISECNDKIEAIEICSATRPPHNFWFRTTKKGEPLKCPDLQTLLSAEWFENKERNQKVNFTPSRTADGKTVLILDSSKLNTKNAWIAGLPESNARTRGKEEKKIILKNLPTVKKDESIQIILRFKGIGEASMSAELKAGKKRVTASLPLEHARRMTEVDSIHVKYQDGSTLDQAEPKIDRGMTNEITVRTLRSELEFKDGLTGQIINNWGFERLSVGNACRVTQSGQALETPDQCASRVRIRAPDYTPIEIALGSREPNTSANNIVSGVLLPEIVEVEVSIPASLEELRPTLSAKGERISLPLAEKLSLGGKEAKLGLGSGIDLKVLEQRTKAFLKVRGKKFILEPEVFKKTVNAASAVCSEEVSADVSLAISGQNVNNGNSGEEFEFVKGLTYEISARPTVEGFSSGNLDYKTAAAGETVTVPVKPDNVTRRFQFFEVDPFCGGDPVGLGEVTFKFGAEQKATDSDGVFEVTRASSSGSVEISLADDFKDKYLLKSDDSLQETIRISEWDGEGEVCDIHRLGLVQRQRPRTFRVAKLDSCSTTSIGGVENVEVSIDGKTGKTDSEGLVKINHDFHAKDIPISLEGDSLMAYDFVLSTDRRAERHQSINLPKWDEGKDKWCKPSLLQIRAARRPGESELPILTLEPLSETGFQKIANLSVNIKDQCGATRAVDAIQKDDGNVVIPAARYTTDDKNITIDLNKDVYYDSPEMTSIDLSASSPIEPIKLRKRTPGVMVLISATSNLSESYSDLVPKITNFLQEEITSNGKVVLAHSNGPEIGGRFTLPRNVTTSEITDHLRILIDPETTPYPLNDLNSASTHLAVFNPGLPNYRNKLFYIVPSDPICRMTPADSVREYAASMDITVFEIKAAKGYRKPVCLSNITDVEHHYISSADDLQARMEMEAVKWRQGVSP